MRDLRIALPPTPFTVRQALERGMSRRALDELVATHEIRRVLTGVYVRSDLPDTIELRVASAKLVFPPFVVLCDRTAAWIWGVDTFDYLELEFLPPLETWSLRGRARVRRKGCSGGNRDLRTSDFVMIDGVLVTTPLRTALDLACRLRRRAALAALDAFMREHGLTREQLRRELVRYYRRRGVVQARRLVGLADGRAESAGESWTRMEMSDHGLPAPELQWWIFVDGVPTFRLDMAYPKHKVAVEYDGREFHEGTDNEERDEARRTWLRDQGWTVIVVTKDMFTPEAIDEWIQEIRDALAGRPGRP
ncbi:MAG: DUF559 domain-containing protein [Nocardioides sp.]